ncbi:MAG: hypothetical protein MZV64_04770 [Ignavibacteriales bacterium]|nr:hypothetical protein [Ignavibacteriales bacterium]
MALSEWNQLCSPYLSAVYGRSADSACRGTNQAIGRLIRQLARTVTRRDSVGVSIGVVGCSGKCSSACWFFWLWPLAAWAQTPKVEFTGIIGWTLSDGVSGDPGQGARRKYLRPGGSEGLAEFRVLARVLPEPVG